MPVVIETNDGELHARRARVLELIGLTAEELEGRVRAGQATVDELDAWHEVEAVTFLLSQE